MTRRLNVLPPARGRSSLSPRSQARRRRGYTGPEKRREVFGKQKEPASLRARCRNSTALAGAKVAKITGTQILSTFACVESPGIWTHHEEAGSGDAHSRA